MARYYKLHERDPNRTKDPALKSRIIEAKLVHEIGGRPSQAQLVHIRSIVPLYLEAQRMAERQEKTGLMDKRYPGIQAQIANTMGQLMNSVKPITAKARAKAKALAEAAGEAPTESHELDLAGLLNGHDA